MNLCTSCRTDFASVSAFDCHRTGKHAYTFSEGVKMEPVREDGRRCLDPEEMEAEGLELDPRGRWRIAADVERVRAAFAEAA